MKTNYVKKPLALLLSILMILSTMTTGLYVIASAQGDDGISPNAEFTQENFEAAIQEAVADDQTDLDKVFRGPDKQIREEANGAIWADKSVFYMSNPVPAVTEALGGFNQGEFSVALSALAQGYPMSEDGGVTVDRKVHADVVFVVDVSGSMGRYNMAGSTMTREEGTVLALNSAINKLMEADPETRIGLVCFGTEYYPDGLYIPLDKYTLPAGDTDYVTFKKTKTMGTAQRPDGDIISVATAPSSGVTYANAQGKILHDDDSEFAGTLRLKVSSDNKLTIIREDNQPYFGGDENNERIPGINANGEFTIANNSFITFERINENEGVTYGIFRSNNAYYLYGNLKTEQKTVHDTVEHKKVVNNISTYSSRRTTITLDNGVTFYTYRSGTGTNNSIYVSTSNSSYAQAVATLTSTRKTATYKPTGSSITYTFTRDSSSQITVTYTTTTARTETVFITTNISVPVENAGAAKLFATSGCLENSKGQRMAVTSYTVNNDGTYTQAGLKAAEEMFKAQGSSVDTTRTPVIVLVSDGTPTFYQTDYQHLRGTKLGNGNVNNCNNNMGYYTIKTAIDVKKEVKAFYNNNANTLFYSIGPGVDYLFGQTVLDPKKANLDKCKNNNTTNEQSGTGTPSGLYNLLNNDKSLSFDDHNSLNYVDFSDYSWYGNMSIEELDEAFSEVVRTIFSATTPMSSETHHEDGVYHAGDYMRFYDTIGDGMEVIGDPVVCLDGNTAIPTVLKSISVDTAEYPVTNGKVTINGRIYDIETEMSDIAALAKGKVFVKSYSFGNDTYKDFIVQIIVSAEGIQSVRGEIPGHLVPSFMPRKTESGEIIYSEASPAVLNFKLGLNDEAKEKSGTYYTNSITSPANSTFIPSIGNPFYYDPVEGQTNKVQWSYEGQDNLDMKEENKTGTLPQVSYSSVTPEAGEVFVGLGNNGKIVLDYSQINLIKIWDDGNNAERPDEITLQIDKYINDVFSETVATKNVKKEDCKISNIDGDDHWTCTIDGLTLPGGNGVTYKVTETTLDARYETVCADLVPIQGTNDYQLQLTNEFDTALLSFQVYLVNQSGQPIDENGNVVSFKDRVIKMVNIPSVQDNETISPSREVTFEIALGSDTYLDYELLDFFIPEGYFFYNHQTTFEEFYNGDHNEADSSVIISDNKAALTTKLYDENDNELPKDSSGKYIIDNYNHIRVAFAIVQMNILPDVVVLDYGKPIASFPIENDGVDTSRYHISGLTEMENIGFEDRDEDVELKSSLRLNNGVAKIEGTDKVIYSPFRYMSSIDELTYYIEENGSTENCRHLFSTISFIPATTVYYEDNFGGSNENGGLYINYTGDWYTVSDNGSSASGVSANTDINDRQDRGEVAQGNTPYGYDSSYDDCTHFSNGTAAKVTGTVTNGVSDATARFTFTGTGFDIISRTDLDCGMIGVDVYYPGTKDLVTRIPVINKGVGTLYQIPVISCEGLPYGTYDVEISVKAPLSILGINGSNFYLDAIRIYNPMGLNDTDNDNYKEANNAYREDFEADAVITSVRDIILQADELLDTEKFNSAVYVDTLDYTYSGGAVLGNNNNPQQQSSAQRESLIDISAIKKFELIGPNEEVYLSPGCGVGFTIEAEELPKTVQIGVKVPKAQNADSKLTVQTYGSSGSAKTLSVSSATEMFYDITPSVVFSEVNGKYRATLVLSNAEIFSGEDDIVSITNIKLTYGMPATLVESASAPKKMAVIWNPDEEYVEPIGVSFMAGADTFRQAFDTVYVQCAANTPNYDITSASSSVEVFSGHEIEAQFTTSRFVEDIEITDKNGNIVEPLSLTSEVDDSLVYSDNFLNSKTWKAVFAADEAGQQSYTVKAADGNGKAEQITTTVLPVNIISVSVINNPSKTSYKPGEKIDTKGLTLEVKYSDGSTGLVTSGYTLSSDNAPEKSGRISVFYEGFETGFDISVKSSFIDKIISFFMRILRFLGIK